MTLVEAPCRWLHSRPPYSRCWRPSALRFRISRAEPLHIGPAGERFSDDRNFFHNAGDAANQTFAADAIALRAVGYEINTIAEHRGFVSAVVRRDGESTILDWAHESAWRFSASLGPTASRTPRSIFDAWSADAFIAANTRREPGALLQDRRTGSFLLPQSEDDWAHTREHRRRTGWSHRPIWASGMRVRSWPMIARTSCSRTASRREWSNSPWSGSSTFILTLHPHISGHRSRIIALELLPPAPPA